MGICCRRNNNNSDGPTSMQEGEPQNPFKPNNRKCTDMLCSLVFILFWIGMIIIAGIGYAHGEPKRLVYGTDWKGRTCGVKSTSAKGNVPAYDFTNYPYLLYPRLAEDMVALYGGNPSTAELLDSSNLAKFYGVCVTKCPMLNDSTNPLYIHAYQDYTTQKEPVNNEYFVLDATKEDENAGSPWRLMMDTTEVLYRCVELSKIDVVQTARCVDECTPGELVNVNLTCGRDYDRNPMVECGEKDCTEVILAFRSNCTSIERTRQENQVTSSRTDPITNMMGQDWYMVARWMGDVQKAALPILICGGLFALFLGFLWLVLLRYCAGLFVWLAILSVAIMQGVITLFCAFEGGLLTSSKVTAAMTEMGVSSTTLTSALTNSTNYVNASGFQVTQDQQYYWAIACYVMIVVDVALFLVLIFMCGRIRIAIGIIREASKALQAMPSMVLYPILPTLFATGLVAYWVVAAAYITTSANLSATDVTTAVAKTGFTPPPIAVEMKSDRIINYLLIYHLFGLLWTSQFIQAIAYTTLAGCFCEYYWTMDKRQVKGFVVGRSMYRTVRYHFGTMAFGSLIIAIVQMVRLGLEYIDQQMKSTKQGNTFVKIVMLCLKCCLWCFEKVVKFLNANAYIMVAMKGSSFCPAMKDSFLLLFTNAARVATVSIITRFLMMMGKVFIAAFCMFFMFLFIRHPPSNLPTFFMGSLDHISSPIFPMLITGLLGYTVASFFLDVYGTGIDTILLCFCEDCKVNKGSDKYYMSDELFAFIDGPAKKNAFKVYQPTRDVSSRDRPEELQPVTVAPIYATSPPVGKRS